MSKVKCINKAIKMDEFDYTEILKFCWTKHTIKLKASPRLENKFIIWQI